MRVSSLCALVSLSTALPALAGVQEVWWNITYVSSNPDGLFERRVIGVNDTWPPPPLDVQSTDSLVVHVTNSLDKPTTLHHHGMLFNSTPWMDGAKGISECGIPPGGKFDYVVPINSSGQVGTYWVHAHSGGQYVDGLRAPLIIHPAEEPSFSPDYDDEYTVVLGDWYHEEHPQLMKKFISTTNPDGVEPVADSGLVYFAHKSEYLKPRRVTGSVGEVGFNENSTLPFEPGKTYRLRLINMSAFAMFYFWIDGHDMRLIEVDGIDVEESYVSSVSLDVAQRYSVLVTARNDTALNWAIHANMDTDMFDYVPPHLNPNVTSVVTYNDSAPVQDNGPISRYVPIDDMTLVPKESIAAPEATRMILLEVALDTMDDGTNRAMFDMVTYNYPLVPALFSELSLGDNATVAHAYGPSTTVLDHMEVVDIVIKNTDDGDHPFHLHGHTPMLIGRTGAGAENGLDLVSTANLSNPMRRDTFHIPADGTVTLRVVADNPGAWFFHCHMEWHLESGLAFQFVEAPLQAQKLKDSVPQEMYQNFETLGMPYSGNAAGHASASDLGGLPLGPYPRQEKKPVSLVLSSLLDLARLVFETKTFIILFVAAVMASPFLAILYLRRRPRPQEDIKSRETKAMVDTQA